MNTHEYIVRVNYEEGGSLWAEVLDLPGCFASGDTLDELRDALEDAISLCVAEAGPVKPMSVGELRVRVPA